MELEKKLHDEISRELDILEGMEGGTESYKALVDGLTKLTDRAIEIDKSSEGYRQLMSVTKEIAAATVEAEAQAKIRDIHAKQRIGQYHPCRSPQIRRCGTVWSHTAAFA